MPRKLRTSKRRLKERLKEQDRTENRRSSTRIKAIRDIRETSGDIDDTVDRIDEEMHRSVRDQFTRSEVSRELLDGVVAEYMGRTVRVNHNGEDVVCRLRSTTRFEHSDSTVIAVGDRVHWFPDESAEVEGVVYEVLPRKSRLSRASRLHPDVEQVLVANVDQVVLVVSVRMPVPKLEFIDRTLISATCTGLPAVICFNKIDLAVPEELSELSAIYEPAGFHVIHVSAETGEGLQDLKDVLQDRVSVFTGQSGVGKSSLANALDPRLDLKVGTVMEKSNKGRHTTSRSILVPFQFGGFLVDTPGIKLFELWGIKAEDLQDFYPDFKKLATECRFRRCRHISEPDCAVLKALDDDVIHPIRYANYLRILETLEDKR